MSTSSSWAQGIVIADDGIVIARPRMPYGDLKMLTVGRKFRMDRETPVYKIASVGAFELDRYNFYVGYYFTNDILTKILLTPDPDLGTPKETVAVLTEWVRRQTGQIPPIKFDWGDIRAIFDSLGGFSCIKFRYDR